VREIALKRPKFVCNPTTSNNHARQALDYVLADADCGGFRVFDPEPSGEGPNDTFDHAIDSFAFIDKVVFGSRGFRRKRTLSSAQNSVNLAIGGPGRLHARSQHGHSKVTRQPYELRYGRLQRRFVHCPEVLLVVRSSWMPLTCSQFLSTQNDLLRQGARSYPANVELTFDITQCSLEHIREVCRVATRKRSGITSVTGKTLYYGSPRSAWQLRVYEKQPALRIEFVFRLPFLRQHGIHAPHDICKLARINLRKLITISDPMLSTKLLRMQQRLIW
jgi:hypothetical protein